MVAQSRIHKNEENGHAFIYTWHPSRQSASCLSASSYGEYGSHGLAFILDRNRISVAISRAQCLAIVVADLRIAGAVPGSLDEMMLINLFCKLADVSIQHT